MRGAHREENATRVMPPRFHSLIATQFVSALADNALLVVTIALLQRTAQPEWWIPLLKFFLIVSYVILAPLVGALADLVAKQRLMVWMNGVKLAGAFALCLGAHPLAAFAVIGLGAAAYAPAKYGLIIEWVGPSRLVAANAWIEVSVVGAILLGTAAGGFLVSSVFIGYPAALLIDAWGAAPWPGCDGGPGAGLRRGAGALCHLDADQPALARWRRGR